MPAKKDRRKGKSYRTKGQKKADAEIMHEYVVVTRPGRRGTERIEQPTRAMLDGLPVGTSIAYPDGTWSVQGASMGDVFDA